MPKLHLISCTLRFLYVKWAVDIAVKVFVVESNSIVTELHLITCMFEYDLHSNRFGSLDMSSWIQTLCLLTVGVGIKTLNIEGKGLLSRTSMDTKNLNEYDCTSFRAVSLYSPSSRPRSTQATPHNVCFVV
ncbi:hypothetical protein GN958_ATG18917 [Phytophthora infestans]|uniref:Uncharacterized protein n=1 Tax=Phytophthora infestans TaxID=4787 RepID=A0A8S9TYZ8_PHYIN|nr:hypothetical protein GN958_ATG18917 [Phytophthora infestans]